MHGMRKILVIAEHLGGKLNSATARAVSAAIAVKPDPIYVLVLSDAPDAIAAAAAAMEGDSKVLAVARAENAHPLPSACSLRTTLAACRTLVDRAANPSARSLFLPFLGP